MMWCQRTDLAAEAWRLWRESAAETSSLRGVCLWRQPPHCPEQVFSMGSLPFHTPWGYLAFWGHYIPPTGILQGFFSKKLPPGARRERGDRF